MSIAVRTRLLLLGLLALLLPSALPLGAAAGAFFGALLSRRPLLGGQFLLPLRAAAGALFGALLAEIGRAHV